MLYLMCDVLFLAEVFENFVKTCAEKHAFSPLYNYSLPGHTWKVGLRLTKIALDHIKDKHFLLLLENNIRGGNCTVLGDMYRETSVSTYILYIDGNILNGYAMSQYLPTGEFEQTTTKHSRCQQLQYFHRVRIRIPSRNQTRYGKPAIMSLPNTSLQRLFFGVYKLCSNKLYANHQTNMWPNRQNQVYDTLQ